MLYFSLYHATFSIHGHIVALILFFLFCKLVDLIVIFKTRLIKQDLNLYNKNFNFFRQQEDLNLMLPLVWLKILTYCLSKYFWELNTVGVGLVVGLEFWSLFFSRSQVRFSFMSLSLDKSIHNFDMALNGLPQVNGEIGPLEIVWS